MKKASLFVSLLMAMTGFSQRVGISGNEDSPKYRFESTTSDSALTGFIYSKIKTVENGYFICFLADTTLKANCTLLDNNLKTIIPSGQFSEIILSEDGNYATVAGAEYSFRMRESSYDTITIVRSTKDWGVYDIKNKKLILPIKYNYLSKVYKDGLMVFNKGGIGHMNENFGQGGLFGIINLKGEVICKAKYTYIGPYNDKGIALAVIGGDNMDGVNYGDLMAVNKKGENIKPNFYIDPYPIVKKVYVETDKNQHLLYLNEVVELMDFKNELDTLKRDSLFNQKYMTDSYQEDLSEFSADGYEIFTPRTAYEIYDKDSRVDKFSPLPSNLKYYYNPVGSPVKNWGKYSQYKTNAVPFYAIFNDGEKYQAASFCTVDSIFVAEYDSLELDYMYPGIYNQNKKVLNKHYFNDLRLKKSFYDKLNDQGLIFRDAAVDTVIYKYQLTCDSVESVMTICKRCYSDESQFAKKYYYKKRMGLLINEEVMLPPIYNYVVFINESDYLLLDSTNHVWNYNLQSNTLSKSNAIFDKIVNRRVNMEDSHYTVPELFVVKNPDKKFVAYGIENNSFSMNFDSAKVTSEAAGFTEDGGELFYTTYMDLNSSYDNGYGDLVIFRGDSAFTCDLKGKTLTFKDKIKNLFTDPNVTPELALIDRPVTFKKIKYKSYYFQRGFYLLETSNKKYIYSNTGFFTTNSIKVDSVRQLRPYMIYYSNNKMFIANYKSKNVVIQNKKTTKEYITLLDSGKQIELIDKYDTFDPRFYETYNYDNVYHDLYKVDGVYKSVFSKKIVPYTPTRFKDCKIEQVRLFVDDKERGVIRSRQFYVVSKNEMKYLCTLKEPELKHDSINNLNIVSGFKDEQYEVLDSAKSFEIAKIEDYPGAYKLKGTYKADGMIRSTNSFKKLPVQYMDSLTLLPIDEGGVEAYAFCKNKSWKILCVNLLKPEEFIIFDQWEFKSYHDARKTLYPYQTSYNGCDIKIQKQFFREKIAELAQKARDGQSW